MKKTKKLTVRAEPLSSLRTQFKPADIRKIRLAAAMQNKFTTAFARDAILAAADAVLAANKSGAK
jgi:hypothetical protein